MGKWGLSVYIKCIVTIYFTIVTIRLTIKKKIELYYYIDWNTLE